MLTCKLFFLLNLFSRAASWILRCFNLFPFSKFVESSCVVIFRVLFRYFLQSFIQKVPFRLPFRLQLPAWKKFQLDGYNSCSSHCGSCNLNRLYGECESHTLFDLFNPKKFYKPLKRNLPEEKLSARSAEVWRQTVTRCSSLQFANLSWCGGAVRVPLERCNLQVSSWKICGANYTTENSRIFSKTICGLHDTSSHFFLLSTE